MIEDSKYTIYRDCKDCANTDQFLVSKEDIAFLNNNLYWNKHCSKCGSIACAALSYQTISIDSYLMSKWSVDSSLYFLDQDEDIILAEEKYVDLLFEFIDQSSTLPLKKGILLEALYILIYNLVTDDEEDYAERALLLAKIKDFLLNRKLLIKDFAYLTRDYIKEIVYAELGIRFEMMKIKVCGMKNPKNISDLSKLPIDYMGLIFYSKSPRYIGNLDPDVLDVLPSTIDRVGVFVNEDIDIVLKNIEKYTLKAVQLHGQESPQYCLECSNLSNAGIIKAFNVASLSDFEQTEAYEDICSYFLFDTKTSQHGGSGQKFDWFILNAYKGEIPFFLSGGISVDDVEAITAVNHPKLYALDLNSKFEIEAGIKNIELIDKFIKELRYE